ncbi:hypothetical protein [Nostoc sp.]|uniref:hypothetical protein n=1 Tax=Nostoc sp. TaxID=1180 RepID=UPI002FF8FB66
MEFHGSHPYTEIHEDLIPKEYFLSEISDSWNIPPKDDREIQEIVNSMGVLNATDELHLLSCLIRRLAYTFRGLPSAKSCKGLDFDILCEQYISRLTVNQRIETIQELANKINLQRFYEVGFDKNSK